MKKELFEKYIRNTCTPAELDFVLEWLRTNGETPEGKMMQWKIWQNLPEEDEKLKLLTDPVLDKLHHKLNLVNSGSSVSIRKNFTIRLINIITKIAAALLLPVLGFVLYMNQKYYNNRNELSAANNAYNEIYSSVDAITKVTLPDGTKVWLNHSSVLKYPSVFDAGSRSVELSGEGFFEVVLNPDVPFVVKADEISVIARGTTFNILAYPGENKIETLLLHGKVELKRRSADNTLADLSEMKPSEMIIYNTSSKEIVTREITDERYYSWKDGKLIFKKERMEDVEVKLERWFNVDIHINDRRIFDLTLNATFRNETLAEVLEMISLAIPVNYSVSARRMLDDGSYSKRKVNLTYKK
jgi:transmembrane sensor